MAAVSIANRKFATIDGLAAVVNTADTFKQGQFVKRATVGGERVLRPATLNTDCPTTFGVIAFTDPPESEPGGPNEPRLKDGKFEHTGVFLFKGKSAETYKAGDKVVIDETPADAQSVRLQGADAFGNIVGEVAPDVLAGGLAGANGFNIPIWIAPPGLGRNSGTALILL